MNDVDRIKAITKAVIQNLAEEERVSESREMRVLKTEKMERKFWAVVMEPDSTTGDTGEGDAHGDTITAEVLEKTAHDFMLNSQNIYVNHSEEADAAIIESFLAPVDFTVGDETVKKGSWVLAVIVYDDELWQAILDGEVNAFSPGGWATVPKESV